MPFDLLVKNGCVVDGTGAPRFNADVAVADGKIVEVGKVSGSAERVIDASDLVVAPGFVDPHTHYDAQICWDSLTTPSSWHGVTTLVMGNCGVGLAPCKPEAREITAWDLVNVEAIPFEVLNEGVTWDWETFPEYMDAAERRGSGVNLGFMAALTPFRHYVMGEASLERAANAEETAAIRALIHEAVSAGAFGLTTTNVAQHIGYQGRPIACRNASRDELAAYASVLKELGRGSIELALTNEVSVIDESERALLDMLLTESGRPVTWLALLNRDDKPDAPMDTLRDSADLLKRGAIPQVTCRPLLIQINLRNPFIFANLDCWNPAFNREVDEQIEFYRGSGFRDAFRRELKTPKVFNGKWERAIIHAAESPEKQKLLGRNVAEVARERGADPVDTFLDLAIEDNLDLEYTYELFNADESRIPELITDPRTMIGLSDGGAHVDMLCDAGYCTYLLGTWVREREAMTLEHAVKRITSEPAAFYGIRGRGKLKAGLAADLAIFDLSSVGSAKRGEMRNDLPGGGRRLVMPAKGVEYSVVNGQVLYAGGEHSGALPGTVLRSGSA
jgi:N-acyl-D-aspartate/D-glutamate deacylase